MGILASIPVIGKVVSKGLDVVDSFVEDKDKANQLKAEIKKQIENNSSKKDIEELKAQTSIVLGEINGESPVQRKWRPHLMYVIMFLLVFNGVAVPLLDSFGYDMPTLEAWKAIPPQMWKVLMIGLGGYIGGRSAEKISASISDGIKNKK